MRGSVRVIGAACGLAFVMVGCGPKMNMADMKLPQRPMELDQLGHAAGNWEYTMEYKMAGMDKPMTGHGTTHAEWDCDRWVLVEHIDGQTDGLPGMFHAVRTCTYDPSSHVYRTSWMDNGGSMSSGTATYDAASKTWHESGKGKNMMNGAAMTGKMTMKVVDDNNVEMSGTDYDCWGMKTGEMTIHSKRKM